MSEEKAEAGTGNPFRDNMGRFCKGNPGGPGNPHARYAAELRKAFAEEVKAEDLRKVARAMLQGAQEGDTAAARLVLAYTLGKPMGGVDPDRVDELECKQWMNEAVTGEQAQAVIQGMGATLFSQFLRGAVPILSQIHCKTLTDALTAPPATGAQEEEGAEGDEGEEERPARRQGKQPKQAGGAEKAADPLEAHREAVKRVPDELGLGRLVPIRPVADGKRPSGNSRAANPPAPEGDGPAG
jgi:hypothetical protein